MLLEDYQLPSSACSKLLSLVLEVPATQENNQKIPRTDKCKKIWKKRKKKEERKKKELISHQGSLSLFGTTFIYIAS